MGKLGVDIGTTTITTVYVEDNNLLEVKTDLNCFLSTKNEYEFIQDPQRILAIVLNQIDYFFSKYSISEIGITGQMHGILYTNEEYEILSPLYTWCDQRGGELVNGCTYQEVVKRISGLEIPVGYGLLTHYFNLVNGLVPKKPYKLTTIHDYVSTYLAKNSIVTHPTDAMSFGAYDLEKDCFKLDALKLLGIDEVALPKVTKEKYAGIYRDSHVKIAIGDNQASFYGSVNDQDALLINIGTGSQVSIKANTPLLSNDLETRPYLNNDYLYVGASICGGKAFEAIAKLYSEIAKQPIEKVYQDLASIEYKKTDLKFKTSFLGTRKDKNDLACITNISLQNFNKNELVISLLEGIADELYAFTKEMNKNYKVLIGSGNGIRKNLLLQKIITNKFNIPLIINEVKEEAAYGAAIF